MPEDVAASIGTIKLNGADTPCGSRCRHELQSSVERVAPLRPKFGGIGNNAAVIEAAEGQPTRRLIIGFLLETIARPYIVGITRLDRAWLGFSAGAGAAASLRM